MMDHQLSPVLVVCQLFFVVCLLFVPTVTATYSIVATDATTRQVGGAGATCLQGVDIYEALYHSVPNRSVLHTQGILVDRNDPIVTTALDLMQKNESLEAILQEMQNLDEGSFSLDDFMNIPNVESRQYTVANFTSQSGYSGGDLADVWAYFGFGSSELVNEGKDLLNDRFTYRTAGNVVKIGTNDAMKNGFEAQDDQFNFGLCDMAGKLMTAMYRVADGGLGDDICLNSDGTTGTGAYLHIDNADGTEFIHINVIDSNPKEPIEELKERFLEWRNLNPCGSTCDDTALRFRVDWNGRRITRDCNSVGNRATVQRMFLGRLMIFCSPVWIFTLSNLLV